MNASVTHTARRFRARLRRALLGRGAVAGASAGAAAAGLLMLAGRFIALPRQASDRLALAAAVTALAAGIGAARAMRRTPALPACLAALDAAARAGGLVMSASLPGAAAWRPPAPPLPRVVWREPRLAGGLALALTFVLLTALLPQRFFVGAAAPTVPPVAALVERTAARIADIEEEQLLPAQAVAALSNQVALAAASGDASDPARTLEALDHVAEELARAAEEQAAALAAEQETLQAALALAEQLASRLDEAPLDGALGAAAAEALARFLSQAPLTPALASNLLTTARLPPGLTPAALRDLAGMLRDAGALNEARLVRLADLELVKASACRGGSCTNAADCASALARLLDGEGKAAEAAAALAALCAGPGAGGISRGRGDAPLTWTDPATREHVAFKDEAVASGRHPAADTARLAGLSAAAPEVPAAPTAVNPGALGPAAAPRGAVPQAPLLPRHREAVARFFAEAP